MLITNIYAQSVGIDKLVKQDCGEVNKSSLLRERAMQRETINRKGIV